MAEDTATLHLAHVSLGVSNLEASEHFYRDVLQLETSRTDEDVVVRMPGFSLLLRYNPPPARGKFHIAFYVDSPQDVDRWAQRLRDAKVQITAGPSGEASQRQLHFIDPDDYDIKIYVR